MNFNAFSRRLACAGLSLAAASLAAQAQTAATDPAMTPSTMPDSTRVAQASGTSGTGMTMGSGDYSLLPYTRRGYVGLNLGQSEFDTDCGTGGYACKDSRVSGYLYTGGMVNDWLGAEVGYFNSGRAERSGGGTRAHGLNLSAVARLPLGAFNVFAKAGAMYGETRVSTGSLSDVSDGKRRGWAPTYGAGVGYDLSPTSGLVLEWSRYDMKFAGTSRENVDTTSLGYVHRF